MQKFCLRIQKITVAIKHFCLINSFVFSLVADTDEVFLTDIKLPGFYTHTHTPYIYIRYICICVYALHIFDVSLWENTVGYRWDREELDGEMI